MFKRISDIRLWLVLLAFLGTVGVLFGGQKLATKYRVENPAQRSIRAIKAVKNFNVKPKTDGLLVELKLDKVGNLETVLELVKEKVELHYAQPVRYFKINGQPDSKLQQIRYDLSFYLEEALVSGRYIQLKQAMDGFKPVNAKIYLGMDFVYIQLEKDSHYLYDAIPRQSNIVSANNNQGGDSV